MGYIQTEDPDPGRCKNYRTVMHNDNDVETLRCLEYENTHHECIFPEPRHVVRSESFNVFNSQSHETESPKPWVKPEPKEETD